VTLKSSTFAASFAYHLKQGYTIILYQLLHIILSASLARIEKSVSSE